LSGDKGSGKSGVLLFATMWAHKNNWIVVNVPSAYELTQTDCKFIRHHKTSLYLQNEFAREWLEFFKNANKDLISKIRPNLKLYGKYNFSGVHEEDPDPAPNLYNKRQKTYFKDYEVFLTKDEIILNNEQDKKMEIKVSDKLQAPKTILEIVDYGI